MAILNPMFEKTGRNDNLDSRYRIRRAVSIILAGQALVKAEEEGVPCQSLRTFSPPATFSQHVSRSASSSADVCT